MSWKKLLLQLRCAKRFAGSVKRFSSAANLPKIPGPTRYPILGPLNEMLIMGNPEKLHLTMDNYHRKYGPVVHINLGGIDSVFLSSADFIRSVYLYEGKHPKHIVPPSWHYFNQKHKIERGLLFMDDEEWHKHRQIMNAFLLRDCSWIETTIEATSDTFVNKIKRLVNSETGTVVETLETELYLWSAYSILNLMLGSSVATQSDSKFDENVLHLVTRFGEIMKFSAKLMSIPPSFADKWNLKIWRDFENAAKESLELSRSLISTLNNEMESSSNGLLQKMKLQNFSEDIIARLFTDLLIAAGDTTVTAVKWYLYRLSKDLQLQNRMRKSCNENPDTVECPLVRAGLREVLRLYPIATFLGRVLDSDAKIGQYTVPKGWLAIMSLFTSSRDPENFSDPLEFVPDRWLRADNKTGYKVFKPHGSMPFAMGGRSCIGRKVANFQVHCLITKMLQQFHMESLNKEEVQLKSELAGIPDRKILIAFRNFICESS